MWITGIHPTIVAPHGGLRTNEILRAVREIKFSAPVFSKDLLICNSSFQGRSLAECLIVRFQMVNVLQYFVGKRLPCIPNCAETWHSRGENCSHDV